METSSVMNAEIKGRIEKALDSIRPYLEADGGDVRVLEVTEEMVVKLELLGACGSCRMSTMTLKAGVEDAIKRAVPQVTSVVAVNLTAIDDPKGTMPGMF